MAVVPILRNLSLSASAIIVVYAIVLGILTNPWIQRHALYAHKIRFYGLQDVNAIEEYGFCKNQVTPFTITTPDNVELYAWHIIPLGIYAKHETEILQDERSSLRDIKDSVGFKLLTKDPESRLVITFHGNAGTVIQGWRTDTYRSLYAGAPDKIHVLTIDYRGFGESQGFPTEQGLLMDAVTIIDWAMKEAGIPSDRIVLVGQSLGTGVTSAAANYYIEASPKVEFSGVILVAGFSDMPTLMLTYAIGGYVSILSPFKHYPTLQKWLGNQMHDTWDSASRLTNLVKKSEHLTLTLLHAENDWDIPWKHADALFYSAVNGTTNTGLTVSEIEAMKTMEDFGSGGRSASWTDGKRTINEQILKHGGHNRMISYAPVSLAVIKSFGL